MKLWKSDPEDIFWIGITPSGMSADSGKREFHINGRQKNKLFVTRRKPP